MNHIALWRAIDQLAARHGLTASGLAKAAGLDASMFNTSKRLRADGKPRRPSTESIAMALSAVGADFDAFAASVAGGESIHDRAIPRMGLAKAGADGVFDATGFTGGGRRYGALSGPGGGARLCAGDRGRGSTGTAIG
jgi:phage repressor protein C with HTH and peptisase S24 domain